MSNTETGARFNAGKPKWSLVPQSALVPMVRVLEYGAKKYAPHNWQRGLPINEICESLKRHLDSFMEGEDNDLESTLSHIGHIQCNALFLSWMLKNRPDLDDRVKPKIEEKSDTNAIDSKFSSLVVMETTELIKMIYGDNFLVSVDKKVKDLLELFEITIYNMTKLDFNPKEIAHVIYNYEQRQKGR